MPKRSLPNHHLIEQLDQAVTELLAAPVVAVESADAELLPLLHVAAQLRQLPREHRDRISLRFDLLSVYLLPTGNEFEHFPDAFSPTSMLMGCLLRLRRTT